MPKTHRAHARHREKYHLPILRDPALSGLPTRTPPVLACIVLKNCCTRKPLLCLEIPPKEKVAVDCRRLVSIAHIPIVRPTRIAGVDGTIPVRRGLLGNHLLADLLAGA